MKAHLAANDTIPPEYLELLLCRDFYHCPPALLPPMTTILAHLTCAEEEAKPRRLKRNGE